jgi:hypothetical protein
MRSFPVKSLPVLALAAGLGLSTAAKADPIVWTNWSGSASTPGAGAAATSVTGALALGTGITVTYSGQLNSVSNEPSWGPDSTYNGGTAGNAPPQNFYSIAEDGGQSYNESFTFSQAVTDPSIAMWSIGNGSQNISLNFTVPFTITSCGPGNDFGGGCITQTGDSVLGAEGNGTITFDGSFTSISFTVPDGENFFALTVGAPGLAPPTSAVPKPSSLALLGTGLLSAVGVARRKFFKA